MNNKISRILIVDDDPDTLTVLGGTLKAKGFDPLGKLMGSEALAQLDQYDFDVALIDLRLEDMSGLEVLSAIKQRAPETECILFTGYASQDSAIQAIQMNAFGYFQKPVDMEQVLLSIQRAVEKRRAARALRESEARYRAVIHFATDAIISADSMGNIIGWNPSATEMFGYTEEEILGQPLMLLLPAKYHEEHLNGMTRVLTGGEKHIVGKVAEMQGLRKGGVEFPLELSLSELELEEEKIFTAIIRDATERKWADGMQKKLSRILSRHVKELNCLYSISEIARRTDLSRDAILQECAYLLVQPYQFPEVTVCRITAGGQAYITDRFVKTTWSQEQAIMSGDKQVGLIEVCYLEEKPTEDEGPFLHDERKVLVTVSGVLGRLIESS